MSGKHKIIPPKTSKPHRSRLPIILGAVVSAIILIVYFINRNQNSESRENTTPATTTNAGAKKQNDTLDPWITRAFAVNQLYREVYTPCWEGAYGAIGDAYLFAATHDSSLMRFHLNEHPLVNMCAGTWVDDRAWICLAEIIWWKVTDKQFAYLIDDAQRRYDEARNEGRLSNHEGFWSWYNYPPTSSVRDRIFTNSNMNQMATVSAQLFEATGIPKYLTDALLVWKGDKRYPGIVTFLYKGNGKWEGKPGLAAFGKQLPWEGSEYCSLGASLYRVTNDTAIKNIVVATAKRITDPWNGWLDSHDYYQIRMDGNGAFVNFLLDAYATAPKELHILMDRIEIMLTHVWTNHGGTATVTLHRESDDGIRNGWNPNGGEDGYGVDEVGTVHAQGEAMRAFGIFAYYHQILFNSTKNRAVHGQP
jgi:hypothetical protein